MPSLSQRNAKISLLFPCLFVSVVSGAAVIACSSGTADGTPPASNTTETDAGVDQTPDGGIVPEPTPEIKGPYDINDVSILFSLPQAGDDSLLKADDVGGQGALLPKTLYTSLPTLSGPGIGQQTDVTTTKEKEYTALRVVALRIDPCFPSLALPSAQCRHQIRLVMQPVNSSGGWHASDQAVHVFYELSATDFDTFAAQLSSLKASAGVPTDGLPLGVHPALKAQGLSGAFAQGLRAALLPKIGAARLTRITEMALPQDGAEWKFLGFDVVSGAAKPITISGTKVTAQSFHIIRDFTAMDPKPTDDDDFDAFLRVSSVEATPAPATNVIADAEGATLRIENPTKRDAEHVSCVSCHTAGQARRLAEHSWGASSVGNPDAFTSGFNLALTTLATPTNAQGLRELRSFGYRVEKPIINQRVINESAAVAKFLNDRIQK